MDTFDPRFFALEEAQLGLDYARRLLAAAIDVEEHSDDDMALASLASHARQVSIAPPESIFAVVLILTLTAAGTIRPIEMSGKPDTMDSSDPEPA